LIGGSNETKNSATAILAGLILVELANILGAQTPLTYNAISDLVPRAEGPAPVLGPANSVFIDPDFGTRILRITDEHSVPGSPGINMEELASWQSLLSADSSKLFLDAGDGRSFFFKFDLAAFQASMIMDPNNPSQPLPLLFAVPGFVTRIKSGIRYVVRPT
jgi:hypothetical protein